MVDDNNEENLKDYCVVFGVFVVLNQMQWQGKDTGTMFFHKHL
mgnify:CR=1 FL=1